MERIDAAKITNPFDYVKPDIKEMEKLVRLQTNGSHEDLGKALDHLLSAGGKRIRPTITILIGKCLAADYQTTITIAAAIELLHTATLVHDDLIDGSLLRRGSPTLNAHWSAGATVLTGDFLFACAAKLASETRSSDVMIKFSDTLRTIVNGEISQMFTSRCKPGLDEYYNRIYAKTASLFETSAQAASLINESSDHIQKGLGLFGRKLGMAFQIKDDILDLTGDESVMGKPKGSDLRQGLITLPTQLFIEEYPENPLIKRILEQGCLQNQDETSRLIENILESDVIGKSQNIADDFIENCICELHVLPESHEKALLINLAHAQSSRTN